MRAQSVRKMRAIPLAAWLLLLPFLYGGSGATRLQASPNVSKGCTVFACDAPAFCDAEQWTTCNGIPNSYCRANGGGE